MTCTDIPIGNPVFIFAYDPSIGVYSATHNFTIPVSSTDYPTAIDISRDGEWIMIGANYGGDIGAVYFYRSVSGTQQWAYNTKIIGSGSTVIAQIQGSFVKFAASNPATYAFWIGIADSDDMTAAWWSAVLNSTQQWQQYGLIVTVAPVGSSYNYPTWLDVDQSGSVVILGLPYSYQNGVVAVFRDRALSQIIFPPNDSISCYSQGGNYPLGFGTSLALNRLTGLQLVIGAPYDDCVNFTPTDGDQTSVGAWWLYQFNVNTSQFEQYGPKQLGLGSSYSSNNGAQLVSSDDMSVVGDGAYPFELGGPSYGGGMYMFSANFTYATLPTSSSSSGGVTQSSSSAYVYSSSAVVVSSTLSQSSSSTAATSSTAHAIHSSSSTATSTIQSPASNSLDSGQIAAIVIGVVVLFVVAVVWTQWRFRRYRRNSISVTPTSNELRELNTSVVPVNEDAASFAS